MPGSDAEATAQFEARMDRMYDLRPPQPTAAIRSYVEAALEHYPDLDDDSDAPRPWAVSSLMREAVGDQIYFAMTFSGAQYARDVLAQIAQEQGLVCYDPQISRLLPERQ